MRRRELLAGGAAALGLSCFPLGWAAAADAPKRKVLMFTRSAGFQHGVIARQSDELGSAEELLTVLGRQHGFDVVCTKDGGVFDSDLAQFDAVFFYTTGDLTNDRSADGAPHMSPEGKQRLFDYVSGGKGFLGSHCASDTFHSKGPANENQDQPDPYIAMLGGEFVSHGRQQDARMKLISPDFPGAGELGEGFELHEEWYALKNFAPDLHVILVQQTQGMEGGMYERPPYPATWARRHGEGRVFYTSMGHKPEVWTDARFQQVVLGGLAWACGNVEYDPAPNIEQATPQAATLQGPQG